MTRIITESLMNKIKRSLLSTLFVGKSIELALYKLALYKKGGNFDWHREIRF
ncbi:uncharacterized protein BT62DRAFT_266193 [Guyanagaster necrorhizus]|uniref:Uncharacterized protein n=1 Tax=Guyanagaster necrorhizus TaxID=856835 RepID=A0A9P8AY22_9AGAR|nr:uncharacterized protein BT62DRAFT_266193 [Guyanagaster necrorhizus MCA 3950]KAG7451806.1 hypothetical protein BT62DRAFT_266193 [Guyanagaster necrorhizus MCA 3950]